MIESGWCPYCQEVTNQQTDLVHRGFKSMYETTCCKCKRLLRWHLTEIKKKEGMLEAKDISDITSLIQGRGAIVTQGVYRITGSQLNQLVNTWKKAGVKEGLARHEYPLGSPCVFCGYNGEGYWQKGTHSEDCPFVSIGGIEDREARLEEWKATKEEKP